MMVFRRAKYIPVLFLSFFFRVKLFFELEPSIIADDNRSYISAKPSEIILGSSPKMVAGGQRNSEAKNGIRAGAEVILSFGLEISGTG